MKKVLSSLFLGVLSLSATSFDKFSYYIAYDSNDATKYALVMPAINKIYTHKAGDILNMHLISDQFNGLPEYNNGEMCFKNLTSNANGSDGASIIANNCYDVKFFYIQKGDKIAEGYPFMLYYKPSDKLYEGLAGQSTSFKVVKDSTGAYASESITNEDYTYFYFDVNNSKVYLGQDAIDIQNKIAEDLNTNTDIEDNIADQNNTTIEDSTDSQNNTTVENPPSIPDLNGTTTDTTDDSIGLPPQVPAV